MSTAQPTIADYAKCVVAVMDALGVERATALGEATGAFVAAELAAAHPARIDSAVLVNCPYYSGDIQQRAGACAAARKPAAERCERLSR